MLTPSPAKASAELQRTASAAAAVQGPAARAAAALTREGGGRAQQQAAGAGAQRRRRPGRQLLPRQLLARCEGKGAAAPAAVHRGVHRAVAVVARGGGGAALLPSQRQQRLLRQLPRHLVPPAGVGAEDHRGPQNARSNAARAATSSCRQLAWPRSLTAGKSWGPSAPARPRPYRRSRRPARTALLGSRHAA